MKAMPVRVVLGRREMCAVGDATHVIINLPGPTGLLALPVILKGTRDGTICWTWNGDTELPTLRPSVLNQRKDHRCHTWVNDGKAQFLDDSNHEHTGKTLDLLDVPDSERGGEE
jgi:hypothetical protein